MRKRFQKRRQRIICCSAQCGVVYLTAIIHQRFSIKADQKAARPFEDQVGGGQIPLVRVRLDKRSVDAAIRHHGQPIGERRHMRNALDAVPNLVRQVRDHIFRCCQMEGAGIFAGSGNGFPILQRFAAFQCREFLGERRRDKGSRHGRP